MASEKQLQANRANAKNSTGPKSLAGKARSRLNSRKHGLTAKMLIIAGENAGDFDQLRAELLEEHEPQSVLEGELVERLAGIFWRLRRVPFFEAAIIDARQAQVAEAKESQQAMRARRSDEYDEEGGEEDADEMSDEAWSVQLGDALIQDGAFGDGLGKLARHETTLMNALTKTLQMLFLLQSSRGHTRGDAVVIDATPFPVGRGESAKAA
ncbi:MAG TPA: hypothetical protein VM163_03735 [bacterium]|nr:hypothetical protein [bacterium]